MRDVCKRHFTHSVVVMVVAIAAMAFSSVSVVENSLRLKRARI